LNKSVFTKAEEQSWRDYEASLSNNSEAVQNFDALDEYGGNKDFLRAGQGLQADSRCGQGLGLKACLNIDLHAHVSLDGVNHAGNVFVRKAVHSCDRPECPVCSRRGWATREAFAIEDRILNAQNGYTEKKYRDKKGKDHPEIRHSPLGEAFHIISSIPVSDYKLSFPKLKSKVIKILRALGVLGGVIIFHAQRYHDRNEVFMGEKPHWYFSPHWHVIGFIDGGYGKCRNCSNYNKRTCGVYQTEKCLACDGFEGRSRRQFFEGCQVYEKENSAVFDEFGNKKKIGGYIIKVKAKRKSIRATAFYQLSHATLVRGAKRATVTWWFGVCSYTKMKLAKEDRIKKGVCPICQHELERVVYVGNDPNSPVYQWWVEEWEEPYLDKDGLPNWVPKPKGGSGSFEKTFA
jgi:hypothetical protein